MSLLFITNATKEPFETTLFLSNRISLPEKRQSSITFIRMKTSSWSEVYPMLEQKGRRTKKAAVERRINRSCRV